MGFDITDRKLAERAMRESERRLRDLIENVQLVSVLLDARGEVTFANDYALELLGLHEEDVVGHNWFDLALPFDKRDAMRETFLDRMRTGTAPHEEYEILTARSEPRVVSWNSTVLHDPAGAICGMASIGADVTERRRAETRLLHNALHDSLTGLPNRALFMDRLRTAMARLKRRPAQLFAVLFLDLDRFKVINDSLGHLAGDQFLVQIGRVLQSTLRSETHGGPAGRRRVRDSPRGSRPQRGREPGGGPDLHRPSGPHSDRTARTSSPPSRSASPTAALTTKARRICCATPTPRCTRPRPRARHDSRSSTNRCTGAPLVCSSSSTPCAGPSRARSSCFTISRSSPSWTTESPGSRPWCAGIIPSAESWARTSSSTLAEETGLIFGIGRWTLLEACRWLTAGSAALPDHLTVNVNLSGRQFSQGDLIEQVETVLSETGLSADRLKLEITESVIMENPEMAVDLLRKLKALGTHVCIDDFGTGYSSLSYLLRFPADTLKIDRSFVNALGKGGRERDIVGAIVSLGKSLDMDVVAEGVETAEQREILRNLGCGYGQGYLFSRPLDEERGPRFRGRAARARTPSAGSTRTPSWGDWAGWRSGRSDGRCTRRSGRRCGPARSGGRSRTSSRARRPRASDS